MNLDNDEIVVLLPLSDDFVASLRQVLPRRAPNCTPTHDSVVFYEPLNVPYEHLMTKFIADFTTKYLMPCGWHSQNESGQRCWYHTLTKRRIVLRFPWEVSTGHSRTRRAFSVMTADIVYVCDIARRLICEAFMCKFISHHTSKPAHSHARLVEIISHFTCCRTHSLFEHIAKRPDVVLVESLADVEKAFWHEQERQSRRWQRKRPRRDALTANERERSDVVFPCNAAAAISLKGGVRRVFLPRNHRAGADDAHVCRCYVSDSDRILTCLPSERDAYGCFYIDAVEAPMQLDSHLVCQTTEFCYNLADADVLVELESMSAGAEARIREKMADSEYMNRFGLVVGASRIVWPFRLALCLCVAELANIAVLYTEYRLAGSRTADTGKQDLIYTSRECLVFQPNEASPPEHLPERRCIFFDNQSDLAALLQSVARDSETQNAIFLMWNGNKWAIGRQSRHL